MVVEKLKAIYSSLDSNQDAWQKAFKATERYFESPEGTFDVEDVKRLLEECYSSDVPRYSKALFDLADLYKPASLADVRRRKAEVEARLEMHQEASTNLLGEYGGGDSIKDELVRLFTSAISLDSFDDEDSDNFNFESRLNAQQFVEAYIFYKLGNFLYLFWPHPELAGKYLSEIEQVLFGYYSKMETLLSAGKREPELPSYLKVNEEMTFSHVYSPSTSPALTLSELFESFLKYKVNEEGLTERITKEYKGYIEIVCLFLGDLPISDISTKSIKSALQRYSKLPVRNKAPYRGMSIQSIEQMSIPAADLIKPKTVRHVQKMLQSLFNYAVQNELLEKSPVVGLKLDLGSSEGRGRFNNDQVRQLLSSAAQLEDEWRRWIVRLGCYTAARMGELVQLRGEDVRVDDGVHYLLITPAAGRLKTSNAFRHVPLHSELLQMGFLDFVGNKKERLFPAELTSHKSTKWFTSFRKKIGIADKNEFNQALSFHSFRHSFVTEARAAGIPEVSLQQVIGHTITGAGITDNYTSRFTVKQLLPVVESIVY